jgi:hypothetical protein
MQRAFWVPVTLKMEFVGDSLNVQTSEHLMAESFGATHILQVGKQ